MWLFSCLFVVFAETEPSLKQLLPTLGATYDVSPENKAKWEAAFKHLQLTNGQVEGYVYPERFDETLGGPGQTVSDGCSWYCGGMIEVQSASSSLSNSTKSTYNPVNLHDTDIQTAWVEGKKDHGIGESITLKASGAIIDQISIWNGYQKSPELYTQNSRPKTLKLYIDDKPMYLLSLQDTRAVQYFGIEPINVTSTAHMLRFEIVEVYSGTKWMDTAISEINFDGTGVH